LSAALEYCAQESVNSIAAEKHPLFRQQAFHTADIRDDIEPFSLSTPWN
jgi:hypothetical protein